MIRYKICPTINRLGLMDDSGQTFHQTFEHSAGNIYFVNILKAEHYNRAKLRIFLPDGNIVEGWQSLDWITLHHIGDLFDGRFNV